MRLISSLALLLGLASGCVIAAEGDSSLLVENDSDFEIHEMYVTGVNSSSWGSNLLRGDVLFPGESMFVTLDCGTYDALLIDETDAECEISRISLCFEDADWIIRNNSCVLFQARAAAAAAAAK